MSRVLAVRSLGVGVVVAVRQKSRGVLAVRDQQGNRVVSAGLLGGPGDPGPPGAPGSGSGVSYSQDHPPTNPLENETWYNPLTLQLQVYTAAGWRPVSPDGGHF